MHADNFFCQIPSRDFAFRSCSFFLNSFFLKSEIMSLYGGITFDDGSVQPESNLASSASSTAVVTPNSSEKTKI